MENRTSTEDDEDYGGGQNRIGAECSKEDIVIYQGSSAPLPNGIPAFSVQILNVGVCIANIHVSCGWFSSYRLVNPTVFRRLYYDDCLVNDGQPLGPSSSLYFEYANSFRYPLSVSSVSCC
ncbi:TPD1 protein homolog 1 [Linum grandiflorum]